MTAIQPNSNFRGGFAHKTLLEWTEGLFAVLLGMACLFFLYEGWIVDQALAGLRESVALPDPVAGTALRQVLVGAALPILVGIYAFTAAARQGVIVWAVGALAGIAALVYGGYLLSAEPVLIEAFTLSVPGAWANLNFGQIAIMGGIAYMVAGLLTLCVTASFGGFLPLFCIAVLVGALPAALYVSINFGQDLPFDLGPPQQRTLILYGVFLAMALGFSCLDWCLRQVFLPVILVVVFAVPVASFAILPLHVGATATLLNEGTLGLSSPVALAPSYLLTGLFAVFGFAVALMTARRGMVPMLVGWLIALVGGLGLILATFSQSILAAWDQVVATLNQDLSVSMPGFVQNAVSTHQPAIGLGAVAVALLAALVLNRMANR